MLRLFSGSGKKCSSSGKEDLAALKEPPFDLILMDVGNVRGWMESRPPGASGKAGSDRTRIPILAMTAHALTETKEPCLRAGMYGYFSKPIDFRNLD